MFDVDVDHGYKMGTQLSPPRNGAHQPPHFGLCLLWPNGRPPQQVLSSYITLCQWCALMLTLQIQFGHGARLREARGGSPGSSLGAAAPIIKHQINPSKHTSESAASANQESMKKPISFCRTVFKCLLKLLTDGALTISWETKEYSNGSQHDGRKSTISNQCDSEI